MSALMKMIADKDIQSPRRLLRWR